MIKKQIYLYVAWILASGMSLASLYLSQILHLTPCTLCWCQRIFLFPLPILLGIALFKGFLGIFPYALPFPLLAMGFAGYQVVIEYFPSLQKGLMCSQAVSCLSSASLLWGFLSPPLASCGGSFLIFLFLLLSYHDEKNDKLIK